MLNPIQGALKELRALRDCPADFPKTPAELKKLAENSASDRAEDRGHLYACTLCDPPQSFAASEIRAHMATHKRPEERERSITQRMARCGVMDEHQRWRLEQFPAERPLIEAAIDAGKGMLIQGTPGTGKTSLVAAILYDRLLANQDCRFLLAAEIFREIRATYRDGPDMDEREVIERFTQHDFLAIDDLGHEGKPSEAVLCVLHEIISKRNGKGRVTAVTTNLTLAEIGERYDGAIRSRLASWVPIVMQGKDWREA